MMPIRTFANSTVFGLLLLLPCPAATAANCAGTTTGRIPLPDLGPSLYLGAFQGGLYSGGSNNVPAAHATVGAARAAAIQPRDAVGNPSPTGKYVLLSIGMSNTTQEFCAADSDSQPCTPWSFKARAAADPRVNHSTLVIVNGARGGQSATTWDDPTDPNYDQVRNVRLAGAGVTEAQVQAAWVKVANPGPTLSLPNPNADAYALVTSIGGILRALRTRYPNIQVVFLSNRIYAGYASTALNPEPYSYESGFACKWVIEAQANQMAGGPIDPRAGDLNYNTVAPWVAWGPYLWADGLMPRSDGVTFACADVEADGTHPAPWGEQKVANLLMNFMLTSPFATPWFVVPSTCVLGDMNFDGNIDGRDVHGFVRTLLNPGGATPAERCAADCNYDTVIDSFDVTPFVTLLLNG